MSIIIIGLPLAILGGIAEAIRAHINKPRVKVRRHRAVAFGYYWDH